MIKTQPRLSIRRQCELLQISRSGFYYEPVAQDPDQLALMKRIDEIHLPATRPRVARQLVSPTCGGMVLGMATKKVTITLEQEHLAGIQKLVAAGKARNVSSFIQHAVEVSLSDVAGWGAMLQLALDHTGGPLTAKERTWADAILKKGRGRQPRRGKAA